MMVKAASAIIGVVGGGLAFAAQEVSNISIPLALTVSISTSLFLAGLSYGMLKRDVMAIAADVVEHKEDVLRRRMTTDTHFEKLDETLTDVRLLLAELKGRREGIVKTRDSDGI